MNKTVFFGDMLKYFDNGRNQLFGRLFGIVSLFLQIAIYLKLDGGDFGLKEIMLGVIILSIVSLVIGYYYSKLGFYRAEVSSRTKEYPELMQTLKNTEEILKRFNDSDEKAKLCLQKDGEKSG